jgi:hypothetical protein
MCSTRLISSYYLALDFAFTYIGNKRLIVAKEGKSEVAQARLHARIQERLNQGWLRKTT